MESVPKVAVVGAGQLARMMAPAANRLGVALHVLAQAPDESAAQVVPDVTIGDPSSLAAVRELVHDADVLTFEHEHVPDSVLAEIGSTGFPIRPGAHALHYAQDKLAMRDKLGAEGIPVPRWQAAHSGADIVRFGASPGNPVIVKTPRGGYDGKGVRVVEDPEQVASWWDDNEVLLVEERVDFAHELAVIVARRPSGQTVVYTPVHTVQQDGVCFQVTAPGLGIDNRVAAAAQEVAVRIAETLDTTGILAVEMFQLREQRDDGARVLVNELALRPHNSGHWTQDGAVTDQFEQHLRAVLDLPLGDPQARVPWTVMVNVLGSSLPALTDALPQVLEDPHVRVHLYGKSVRPGRKLGHVNAYGKDIAEVTQRAHRAAALLRGEKL